jgi:hypothetical protein
VEGLLDRHGLLGVPGRARVDRARDAGPDPEERVELLDRGIGAVGHDRSRVDERAERVRALGLPGPELVGEIAVGRRVAELDRRGDA